MTTNTVARSRYDELHDKYHSILSKKSGTRYERLAAMVFKALEAKNVVIHDLKLVGDDPDVRHQIDVTIETGGMPKRVIIECKDFDISGAKVGLDILRSFRSVVEDTKADEGIVITCNDFTEDARKYARSKGIKLAILRLFEETKDLAGRITKVVVGVIFQQPKNPRATVMIPEAHAPRYHAELAAVGIRGGALRTDPVYFVKAKERRQFNEFLTQRMNDAIKPAGPKTIRIVIPPDGWSIQVEQNTPIPFDAIIIDFEVDAERHTIEAVSNRIAELVLLGFHSADLIIFGDQIEGRAIDPDTGTVT